MSIGVGITPRRPEQRFGTFNAFYGFALTVFLALAVAEACRHIADATIEILIFTMNGLLSVYGQTQAIKRQASIHHISFVFCYLFMAITPLIQLGDGNDPVFDVPGVVLRASLIAIFFTGLGVYFTLRLPVPAITQAPEPKASFNYLPLFILTALVGGTALVIYAPVLFTSRLTFDLAQIAIYGDQQVALIVATILISLPFYAAVIGLRHAWQHRRAIWLLLFGLLLVIAALLNNPIVHARFGIAGCVFFFIDYLGRGRALKLLSLALLAGVLLAPAFQAFRSNDILQTAALDDDANPYEETFLSYDYDAFQTLCYTLVAVDQNGVLWGSNLLGSILFFVPRDWWPGKPEQTSYILYRTIVGYRDIGTDNLSTPLVAEGYYAFWWFGALALSWLYWAGMTRLIKASQRNDDSLVFLLRCVAAGLVLIFLRGTLIVGISAVAGSCFAATLPWLVAGNRRSGKTPALS